MSKIIRTRKPSVLPFYAMALVFLVLCAVLPVYKLWALLAALGGAFVAFGAAQKVCPPRVKNLSILASVRRFQGENKIGNTRNAFGSSGQVVRDALNNLKQFFTSQTLLIVMITKSNGKGNFTFGNQIQYSAHSLFGRLSINHITRKNHQIGFLGIKHFIDSFDRNIRPRIIINVMHICKLHDFELPIGIELQCLGIAGTYKPQQQA